MKHCFVSFLIACVLVIPVSIGIAQNIEPEPIPVDPSNVDLNGIWSYSVTPASVTDMCPMGIPVSGELSISVEGNIVTLMFLSGKFCDPASLCTYTGKVKGEQIKVSTTAIVDYKGTKATNFIALFVSSSNYGWGIRNSRYLYPEGFECIWDEYITISR